ncbi:MAG: septal ring lytic transglycosylase RlpA family protein [Candidatus Aminicenantes bacterium]|nr:septal ring lytic transglycosylase RlpA family protein [Candidatus Aminicenantes bacterium]
MNRLFTSVFSSTLIAIFFILSGCSRVHTLPEYKVQIGPASWYGPDFHGKQTSNKEVYNMYDMTAAHKTLPFNTFVMVTNLLNGKSVTVRINDRGPFIEDRIIDLSYAAARVLDMVGTGVVPVRIEVLEDISPKKNSRKYFVQAGAFIYKHNALSLKKRLEPDFPGVTIYSYKTETQTYYRVRIEAKDNEDALVIAQKLKEKGITAIILEEY